MASFKSLLNCIGVDTSGSVSILRHAFGFRKGQVPPDPSSTVTATVSLLEKARGLKNKHVNLNVIHVGFDALSTAGEATAHDKLDYAILRCHKIFFDENLGIGRVNRYRIDAADAGGADDIGSADEADELSDDWTVDNNGIDVFVVRNISASFVGISPVPGSCKKGSKSDGLLGGEIGRGALGVARTFAHEIGHFLNLPHNHGSSCPSSTSGKNNLMAQTRCASSVRNSVQLTSSQSNTIRGHCSIRSGC